jgi:hypothetical protein
MSSKQHIHPRAEIDFSIDGIFNSSFFWDAEPKKLFIHRDAEFIINRIFRWCNFPGVLDKLEKYYSKEYIRKQAIECESIYSNECFDILAARYDISKDEFLYFRDFKDYNDQ